MEISERDLFLNAIDKAAIVSERECGGCNANHAALIMQPTAFSRQDLRVSLRFSEGTLAIPGPSAARDVRQCPETPVGGQKHP